MSMCFDQLAPGDPGHLALGFNPSSKKIVHDSEDGKDPCVGMYTGVAQNSPKSAKIASVHRSIDRERNTDGAYMVWKID